jgi:hypothetical protein
MAYSEDGVYILEYPVSDFKNGAWQDVSTLVLKAAVMLADDGVDQTDFVLANWRTDPIPTPPNYYAQVEIGPGKDHVLTKGRWMVYLQVDGEINEAGLIEVY